MSFIVTQKSASLIAAPSSGSSTIFIDENGQIGVKQPSGTSGSIPTIASSNTQVIFNNNGNLVGNSSFTFNGTAMAVTGNLDITGNVNVSGNVNYSNVSDLVVGDPLIYIGANNTGDLLDLGIVASYVVGSEKFTGLARNHTTDAWTFFDGITNEPTTVIDWANATYPNVQTGNLTSTANISANYFIGNGSQLTGIVSGITVTNDTTTDSTYYVAFTSNTSGSITGANVSSSKLYFNPSTGQLNATNFNSLSDQNFKTNIIKLDNSVSTINAISGYQFDWIDGSGSSYGVLAQEIEQAMPFAVNEDANGKKSVNYSAIIAYLVEAVKDLTAQVAELKANQ